MINHPSRRQILKGLVATAVIIGFDAANCAWVTADQVAFNFAYLPPLDGVMLTDIAALTAAADDFGHIVHHSPVAVLKPGSIADIIKIVQFARTYKLKIAARGQGHTTFGQAQVKAGIVIDTSTLNQIHSITIDRAVVDAGVRWRELLQATLTKQLTPRVFTDYIELSVGGTLSVGGIGGASHRYGLQIDNVLEVEVVTGEGKLETCSRSHNSDLFTAAIAGLGQCGIIVKATIPLIPAATNVRLFSLYYDDLTTFTRDQRSLIADERFNYVEGQVVTNLRGGWRYLLEAASFYTPPNFPNNDQLLSGLSYSCGEENIEEKSYFDFVNRLQPIETALRSNGLWSNPHPWIDLFVPGSKIESYVQEVLPSLTLADVGPLPILLYPIKRERLTIPLFRVPDEPVIFLFSILRTASSDEATINRMLNANRLYFERNRDLGGYRYSISSIPFTQTDWKQHFGSLWGQLVSAKKRYDPDNLLTPGHGIF